MLSPPIEAYPPTNVIQKFAATQLWQIFKLSLPFGWAAKKILISRRTSKMTKSIKKLKKLKHKNGNTSSKREFN